MVCCALTGVLEAPSVAVQVKVCDSPAALKALICAVDKARVDVWDLEVKAPSVEA